MSPGPENKAPHASPEALRTAIRLYIGVAFGPEPPETALSYLPPDGAFDPAAWLMSDLTERTPPEAPFEDVRSFALRIGSRDYRHMKLRICRPGSQPVFVFTADSHDTFLEAEPGSDDYEGLMELKQKNADMASRITAAWETAGLLTERGFLRKKIREAQDRAGETGR